MFKALSTIVLLFCVITDINAQSFNIPSKGNQIFDFKDTQERNQATFYSEARYENITGITNHVWGKASFDIKDVKSTLNGEVSISTTSIKTGIEKRDENLRSVSWLNSEKYPSITFKIKEITRVDQAEGNVLKIVLLGEFTLCGKTNLVYANATMKYLVESETTKQIMPGDLITVAARFDIKLSDFGITNSMIPNRVGDKIQITVNLVGAESK
jgi:polyisoprenoid-binding protein YceI